MLEKKRVADFFFPHRYLQVKNPTSACGRAARGSLRDQTNSQDTFASTRAWSRSSVPTASGASPDPTTWRCTRSATCWCETSHRGDLKETSDCTTFFRAVSFFFFSFLLFFCLFFTSWPFTLDRSEESVSQGAKLWTRTFFFKKQIHPQLVVLGCCSGPLSGCGKAMHYYSFPPSLF